MTHESTKPFYLTVHPFHATEHPICCMVYAETAKHAATLAVEMLELTAEDFDEDDQIIVSQMALPLERYLDDAEYFFCWEIVAGIVDGEPTLRP